MMHAYAYIIYIHIHIYVYMHTNRYITKYTHKYVYTHTQSDLAGSDKGREMMDPSARTRTDMLCAQEQGRQGMLPSRLLTPMHHHAHTVSCVMSRIQMSDASLFSRCHAYKCETRLYSADFFDCRAR